MRYSTNLNIIIKAIEKATERLPRDFMELENLQTNPLSATKFANACYSRIKENLIEDLSNIRPDYDIHFADGQKILRDKNSQYSFVIHVIEGLNHLVRGISDFTIAIAIEYNGESISLAINKIIGSELFYCEKGLGAYLNNRRIRTSKRNAQDSLLIAAEKNYEILQKLKLKDFSLRNYGCKTLEIAYLASAKFDLVLFEKNSNYEFYKPFFLLIKESGGRIIEDNQLILITNGQTTFDKL